MQRADWFEMSDDPDRARALQRRLAAAVVIPAARVPNPETLTGLDVSYQTGSDRLVAAAVTVHSETGDVLDQAAVAGWATYPYRSGLLALREVPPLLAALDSLRAPPDLLLCDGQGIAHPRRFGLACHLALATGIPAIGVAKTRFVGTHGPVGRHRGDRAPLTDAGELVGYALRTRDDVRPVYVSPGSGIGFEQSCELVLAACRAARLPDPIRAADHLGRLALRGGASETTAFPANHRKGTRPG